jgi:Protein of unknown function (DUF3089)/IPT/TIG domain
MRNDETPRRRLRAYSTWVVGAQACAVLAVIVGALIVSAVTPAAASAETLWVCKPGLVGNPCESSEEATVELGDGSTSIEQAQPSTNPPIDCFYVYPTVASQFTVNATPELRPEYTQIAIDQASRFSQTCKVYVPFYPQLTLIAITTPGDVTPKADEIAYGGMLSAFEEYIEKYNDGRGFVLIGHSQGALLLKQLIKERIDSNATLRKHMVSALLMGGNVLVPKGQTEGGDFKTVPACQSAGETHCVVAYSSFLKEPPEGADFGRVNSPLLQTALTEEEASKLEVLCVNPGSPEHSEQADPMQRYESTTPFPGFLGVLKDIRSPSAPTPWVSFPGQYTGQCEHASGAHGNSASWLQLNDVGPTGDAREQIAEVLGPLWGTHLEDVNVPLGNLVALTGLQSTTYQQETAPPTVTKIRPSSGPEAGGTFVMIRGTGFLPDAKVTIGSEATVIKVVSKEEIIAITKAHAPGAEEVVVETENGKSSQGPSFTYKAPPPPPRNHRCGWWFDHHPGCSRHDPQPPPWFRDRNH